MVRANVADVVQVQRNRRHDFRTEIVLQPQVAPVGLRHSPIILASDPNVITSITVQMGRSATDCTCDGNARRSVPSVNGQCLLADALANLHVGRVG